MQRLLIVAVYVVGLGVVGGLVREGILWMAAADERFAGIERDASAAPPAPFEPPADEGQPTRVEILRLLRSRDFDTLSATFDTKRKRVAQDIRHEAEWRRMVIAFDISDASITPLLDDWIANSTDAVAPYLARAIHLYSLAFEARGTKFGRQTSVEQFAGMARYLEEARADLRAALERDAREVLAYELLIDVARAGGAQRECGRIAREGLAGAPASFRIRWGLAICRLPRWGGEKGSVEAVWEKARPFVQDNPALKALGGMKAYDEGRSAKDDQAAPLIDRAIAAGPNHLFFLERAKLHYYGKRYEAALDDANLGLILSPQHPDLLEFQFLALVQLGKRDEASAVLDILAEVDPTNPEVAKFRADVEQMTAAAGPNGARDAYRRAYKLREAGDDAGALAAFLDSAKRDPKHRDTYLNIDFHLAKLGDFEGIIRHWTNYLSYAPSDGRAYLERAGAYRRTGNMVAAKADIEKACSFGEAKACDIAKSQGW